MSYCTFPWVFFLSQHAVLELQLHYIVGKSPFLFLACQLLRDDRCSWIKSSHRCCVRSFADHCSPSGVPPSTWRKSSRNSWSSFGIHQNHYNGRQGCSVITTEHEVVCDCLSLQTGRPPHHFLFPAPKNYCFFMELYHFQLYLLKVKICVTWFPLISGFTSQKHCNLSV